MATPTFPAVSAFPAATVYIARHGESAWNAARRVQGQTDVPLSERGRAQAALLGERLAAEPCAAIFTSDLARARDTGEAVAEAQARSRGARPRFVVLPALRERDYGSWEGKSGAEVRELREELHRQHLAALPNMGSGGLTQPAGETVSPPDAPPDGESFDAVQRRMLAAWAEIAAALASAPTADSAGREDGGVSSTILIVGHGGSLRALLCGLTATPAAEQGRWHLDNASLSRLRQERGGVQVQVDFWNDCAHLASLASLAGSPELPARGALHGRAE